MMMISLIFITIMFGTLRETAVNNERKPRASIGWVGTSLSLYHQHRQIRIFDHIDHIDHMGYSINGGWVWTMDIAYHVIIMIITSC